MSNPVVSCICVTKGERALPYNCFKEQTYDNLQLVFVHENEDWKECKDPRVKTVFVSPSPKLTLGELYNAGVQAADGEYCIIWDSDDWFHPERVERQFEFAQRYRNKSAVLSHWHMYDQQSGKAYMSSERLWEGSLIAPKALLLKHPYPKGARGVDTRVIEAIMKSEGGLSQLTQPDLYLYSLHADNTCGTEHGRYLKVSGKELDENFAEAFRKRFQESSTTFDGNDVLLGITEQNLPPISSGGRGEDSIEPNSPDSLSCTTLRGNDVLNTKELDPPPVAVESSVPPVVELGVLGSAEETAAAPSVDVDQGGLVDKGPAPKKKKRPRK